MPNNTLEPTTPFIGFVMEESDSSYEIHLINPTEVAYSRVYALTGAFCGDDDGLIETSKVVKEKGSLSPNASVLLERGDFYDLDFVIWYHLDLYANDSTKPMMLWFDLPKGGWGYRAVDLPIVGKQGMFIDLAQRNDNETIEDEIKHLDMNSKYHKSATG